MGVLLFKNIVSIFLSHWFIFCNECVETLQNSLLLLTGFMMFTFYLASMLERDFLDPVMERENRISVVNGFALQNIKLN